MRGEAPTAPRGRRDRPTVVLQLSNGGHRLRYVRLLAEGARGGPVTLLTTTEAQASTDFAFHLTAAVAAGRLLIRTVGSLGEPVRVLVERALAGVPAEAVLVVPAADDLLALLCRVAVRRRRKNHDLPALRFLVMRTPELRIGPDRGALVAVARFVMVRTLLRCWPGSRAFFLTDAWGVVTRRRGYGVARAVRDPSPGLPDVPRDKARAEVGLAAGRFVLGVLGGVAPRKHPEMTVEALRVLPEEVAVLIAGKLSVDTRAWLTDLDGALAERVVVRDGYLSDRELAACVQACDVVVLTYDDLDAPSGLLIAAADAGVPVLAAGSQWLGRVVSARGLGVVVELSTAGVVRGVTSLRSGGTAVRPRSNSSRAVDSFAAVLTGD